MAKANENQAKRLKKFKLNKKSRSDPNALSIRVHPLFLLLGLYYAVIGKIFVFLQVTVCACIHELGHSFVAYKNGYRLNKLSLMPFGAVVSGDIQGLKPIEQIKIALAGPLVNLVVGIFFIATWWIQPNIYPYTELAVTTSLSLALVNLLPAYPLDGGRVLFSILSLYLSVDKAEKVCTAVGCAFGCLLVLLYLITIKTVGNVGLLFFGVFVLVGAFSIKKSGRYIRAYSLVSKETLSRGLIVRRIAVDSQMQIKKLISILDENAINEVLVFDNQKLISTLSQEKLTEIIFSSDIYSPISKFIH